MNVRMLWTLVAMCVGLTLAWLALRTPPPIPLGDPRPPARVALPAAPASAPDAAPALAELASSAMWGPRAVRASAAGSAPADAAEPAWFLSGVYGPADQRVVVVYYEGQARAARQLRVGDRLPDGAHIDAIEIDRVRVRPAATPGKRRPRAQWMAINRGLPVPDN